MRRGTVTLPSAFGTDENRTIEVGPAAVSRSSIRLKGRVSGMSHLNCHQMCSLAIACAFTLSTGVSAADDPKDGAAGAQFKAMDTDGDGTL